MLDSLITRALTVAALAAAVAAIWFWQVSERQARQIGELKVRATVEAAGAASLGQLARDREALANDLQTAVARLDAAAQRTSDACRSDPRVRAAYDVIRVWDNEDSNPAK